VIDESRPSIEPAPSPWELPDPRFAEPGDELLGLGADLAAGTMLAAYRKGLFPMGVELPQGRAMRHFRGETALGWWSPNPRGVLRPTNFHRSRSLGSAIRRFRVTFDEAFDNVLLKCADPTREHGWIDTEFIDAYRQLHVLGWAHSVEVWADEPHGTAVLAGGLFGIEIGGLFAAESMFHSVTNASKVALWALADRLRRADAAQERIIDTQWSTPHLASLGIEQWTREEYLRYLPTVLEAAPALCAGPNSTR